MKITVNGTELTLGFKTKNYMALRSKLKTENLRKTLLMAANQCDYEPLAIGIMTFSDNAIKNIDDAYAIIDESDKSKQDTFLEFIAALGEYGFFTAQSVEQLRTDMQTIIYDLDEATLIKEIRDKAVPEMAKSWATQSTMTTGATTSSTYAPLALIRE